MLFRSHKNNNKEQKPFLNALTLLLSIVAVILSSISFSHSATNGRKIDQIENGTSIVSDLEKEKKSAKQELNLSNLERDIPGLNELTDNEEIKKIIEEAIKDIDSASTSEQIKDIQDKAKEDVKFYTAKSIKIKQIKAVLIENPEKYTAESIKKANDKLSKDKKKQIELVESAKSIEEVNKVELPEIDETLLDRKSVV